MNDRPRCLECDWCEEMEDGDHYVCVCLATRLTRDKLWGPACEEFRPRVQPVELAR